jgi:hypothetical protein
MPKSVNNPQSSLVLLKMPIAKKVVGIFDSISKSDLDL